ncbi:MAG: hypothetical protein H6667_13200 [Ardenticatenaceae bacterium]|nr:hypothetical protein [Ardenticatenaceae bacterium]MCB9442701.1 hypothetical protein [Ardenticatenaceae bacterium]
MPNIPISDPFDYVGAALILVGLFLVLTGLGLIKFEKIQVTSGPMTWIIGGALALLGAGLLIYTPKADSAAETAVPATPPVIAIQTTHGHYFTAFDSASQEAWAIRAETATIGDWEKFKLLCLDDERAAFMTVHGRYLTALDEDWNWILKAETTDLQEFETFTLFNADSGAQLDCTAVVASLYANQQARIALKTWHGRYVTAMDNTDNWNWVIRAETHELLANEKFTAVLLP